MKYIKFINLTATLFLAASASSYASILFQNLGNDGNFTEAAGHGAISHLTSPSYSGSVGCVDATCVYQGSGTRYHTEWNASGTWNNGTTYFGYALYLPTSFQFTGTQRAVTEQYGTKNVGGGTINPDWYQSWVGGGTANRMQFGGGGISDQNTGTMTTGAWHTIETKMVYGSGGSITVWFDGNQAWSLSTTVNGNGDEGNWALGLYEADWDGGNTGNGTTVSVYNAAATIASTYNEANPTDYHGSSFSGNYELECEASDMDVTVQGASKTNGAEVIQYADNGGSNALWSFVATSNGYYQLKNVNSGLDLVVQGASTANGAAIVQWSFGSSGDDQWKPVQNSDGSYTFVNLHSGLLLDDPGSSTTSGTQFDQWASNGGSNQKFSLISR